MTQTVVNSVVVNAQYGYSDTVLSLARDCLEGVYDDYVFISCGSDSYALITSDSFTLENGIISCDTGHCVQFDCTHHTATITQQIPVTGNYSGAVIGQGGGASQGSFTGNSTISRVVSEYDTTYTMSYDVSNLIISNPDDYVIYGSFDDMPHLIEGVQNYAFAAFMLCFGILAFSLVDRIFRRVY